VPSQLSVIDREPIYAALFSLLVANLQGSPPSFVTVGRRYIPPPALGPAQQPALFLVEASEDTNPRPQGTAGKKTLSALLIVHCWESAINQTPGQETSLAATQINALLNAIDTALLPSYPADSQGRLTLGGLVQHCWIEGETRIDQGIFSQQASVHIPLKILVP
jgi:hypothetical protein